MQIREAGTEDCRSILKLYSQPSMDGNNILSLDTAEELVSGFLDNPNHMIYVVVDDSRIVGTFAIIIVQMLSRSGGRMALIEDVVVATEYQGKGIGSDIMKFAVDIATELDCYRISLVSGIHRKEAHEFFKKNGFKEQGIAFSLESETVI